MKLLLKRAYAEAENADGFRVLVDRLWPRGVSKVEADLDLWDKDIAPSPELREWFGHKAENFAEFKRKYVAELKKNTAAVENFKALMKKHPVITLVYGAKDAAINHAVVLREFLEKA